MISLPSSSQLLEAIRRELAEKVRPAVSNAEANASLDMIDALLRSVAIRCDHEIAWMREEIARTDEAAQMLVAAGVDNEGKVAAALSELRDARNPGLHMPGIRNEYDLSGALLSLCIELALPAGGELRKRLEAVLENRLAHELEIRGEFSLAGRT